MLKACKSCWTLRRLSEEKDAVVPAAGASSNLERTTTFGSSGTVARLPSDIGLPKLLCRDCTLTRRPLVTAVGAYSGRLVKLSGLRITLKVPGACDSAFRSRSSSFVRSANEGRLSYMGDCEFRELPEAARAARYQLKTR